MGNTQVICDVFSRFTVEKEVVERCTQEDRKDIMGRTQRKACGEGLDENIRHPYMWCGKIHYDIDAEDFYNFPYAFGALFSLGLYRMYQKEGAAFVSRYDTLLTNTPRMDTETATGSVGIDITTPGFWEDSLEALAGNVEQYEQLAETLTAR